MVLAVQLPEETMADATEIVKKNDFDKFQADRVIKVDEWLNRWENKQTPFHMNEAHKMLKKYVDVMLNGKDHLRILFPLCGKAVDMKWLADLGHKIVGIEVSEKAILEFFTEQSVSYSKEAVSDVPGATLFKSSDGKISIYCCSIYDVSSSFIGKFDGIWDRGSLVAISPCDRQRYSELMLSLMEDDCCYLLEAFDYDPRLHKGPPFFVPFSAIEELYGSTCNIKFLEAADMLTDRQREWGLDYFIQNIYMITLKAT
ncbi:thiopurine S-methyltransferase isoform X2 [Protopterus annectens]|uniref:thiopurine S-methyltransferase isoform X2 n=1 Tax=Protopterus annectens TaxID=7888 RepID=UPI001CF9DB2E|nr:thiopurine S-methyltransferase isoform X2 [Protopterus annectens]